LKNGLREKGDQSIAASLRRTLDFDDVLAITSTDEEVWTDLGHAWLASDVPARSTDRVNDGPLE
jgi:hypothetical protein